ncbi:MAG: tetratricopeptide repeat protein [Planctomycetia bacterium]|nr:tetratricopeptide repeat protein [Planctomycetia bacterium]
MADEPEISEQNFRDLCEQLEAVVSMAEEAGVVNQVEIGDCCVQLGALTNVLEEDPQIPIQWFTRAIEIYDQTVEATDPRLLRPLCELAMIEIRDDELESAISKVYQIHEILRSDAGRQVLDDNPDLATGFYTIEGFIERKHGRNREAAVCFDRAYATAERYLDPDSPEWVQLLANQAISRQDLDDHATAKKLLERAIAILEERLGTDHPDRPLFLSGLATSEQMLGNHERARQLFEQVLALESGKTERMEEPDIGVALTCHNLAEVEQSLGRLPEAVAYSRRAFRILFDLDHELAEDELKWLARNDPDFDTFMRNLKAELAAEAECEDEGRYEDENENEDGDRDGT